MGLLNNLDRWMRPEPPVIAAPPPTAAEMAGLLAQLGIKPQATAHQGGTAIVRVTLGGSGVKQEIARTVPDEAAAARWLERLKNERAYLTDYYATDYDEKLEERLAKPVAISRR